MRRLGTTNMKISPLGLGAWAMGGPGWEHGWGRQDDADSIATVREAVEAGINWIDTAPVYGHGHSEEVVGTALRGLPDADRPYIFTKCGLAWSAADPMAPQRRTMAGLRNQVDGSLRRLGVERIDLLQVHWPADEGPSLEEYWAALLDLKAAGKIRAAGVSNFSVAQLETARRIGHVDTVQPPLSLLNRQALEDVIPWAAEHGTGVIVYSPLESGLLSGSFDLTALPADDWRSRTPEFRDRQERAAPLVERMRTIAANRGTTVAAIAVAWTLGRPGVTGAIVGARRPGQIRGWIAAADLHLNDRDGI
jgi:aryl-alcohol dehydrogenase-like predicted oxidoreductase